MREWNNERIEWMRRNIGLAAEMYVEKYKKRAPNKWPLNPKEYFHIKNHGIGLKNSTKWSRYFKEVVLFLSEQRDLRNAINPMEQLLSLYFEFLFEYYDNWFDYKRQVKAPRLPRVNQINTTSVQSRFLGDTDNLERDIIDSKTGDIIDAGEIVWITQKMFDQMAMVKKYGNFILSGASISYDPIAPELWNDLPEQLHHPKDIPELNTSNLPIRISFDEMLEYEIINPPKEDLEEYQRLFGKKIKRVPHPSLPS